MSWFQKSGSARREARGGRATEKPVRVLGTAGVPDCGRGPQDGPLCCATCARYGLAWPVARAGKRTEAVWLSPPVRIVAP